MPVSVRSVAYHQKLEQRKEFAANMSIPNFHIKRDIKTVVELAKFWFEGCPQHCNGLSVAHMDREYKHYWRLADSGEHRHYFSRKALIQELERRLSEADGVSSIEGIAAEMDAERAGMKLRLPGYCDLFRPRKRKHDNQ